LSGPQITSGGYQRRLDLKGKDYREKRVKLKGKVHKATGKKTKNPSKPPMSGWGIL
jgi:hypothetical protein